jgi:hypothetical protein
LQERNPLVQLCTGPAGVVPVQRPSLRALARGDANGTVYACAAANARAQSNHPSRVREPLAMTPSLFDQLTVDSQSYLFRDGNWTTPAGMFVSTSQGQALTMAFYAKHGRAPRLPEAPSVATAAAKPRKAKLAAAKLPAARSSRIKAAVRRRGEGERHLAGTALR